MPDTVLLSGALRGAASRSPSTRRGTGWVQGVRASSAQHQSLGWGGAGSRHRLSCAAPPGSCHLRAPQKHDDCSQCPRTAPAQCSHALPRRCRLRCEQRGSHCRTPFTRLRAPRDSPALCLLAHSTAPAPPCSARSLSSDVHARSALTHRTQCSYCALLKCPEITGCRAAVPRKAPVRMSSAPDQRGRMSPSCVTTGRLLRPNFIPVLGVSACREEAQAQAQCSTRLGAFSISEADGCTPPADRSWLLLSEMGGSQIRKKKNPLETFDITRLNAFSQLKGWGT